MSDFYLDNWLTVSEKSKVTSLSSYLDERSFYLILNRGWGEAEHYIRLFSQGLTVLKKGWTVRGVCSSPK